MCLPRWSLEKALQGPKSLLHFGQVCEGLIGTGWGGELPQLIAHPLVPFVSPLPGCGQGWWQMICLLHCQTLCSPLVPKWASRRLQEASAWGFSREALCYRGSTRAGTASLPKWGRQSSQLQTSAEQGQGQLSSSSLSPSQSSVNWLSNNWVFWFLEVQWKYIRWLAKKQLYFPCH